MGCDWCKSMESVTDSTKLTKLAAALGPAVRVDEPMSRYTAIRVGGPVDLLVVAGSTDEVIRAVRLAKDIGVLWRVLGSGCNVLVSDAGLRGLVVVNRASAVDIAGQDVWAEAGASLMGLARETVGSGLAGLEWATGLPGTVGGSVIGNAGAFGGNIASVLDTAMVLGPDGEVVEKPCDWFEFEYRGSWIKNCDEPYVVLAAGFHLQPGDPGQLRTRAAEILEWRQARHPTGATMGSTFKNPAGSHAGYLIEQAGLRGYQIGNARISELHGNFFMNDGDATAAEILALIDHAHHEVRNKFGIEMDLEIELLGELSVQGAGQEQAMV